MLERTHHRTSVHKQPWWSRTDTERAPATHTSPPNSPAGARWQAVPLLPSLLIQDKSWGRMACRYRPRRGCATHRWPPSGGFQCSLLSKDKLSNRLLFYEFTLRSISQKRLRKILGLSCSTLRQNSILWKVKRPGDRAKREVQEQGAILEFLHNGCLLYRAKLATTPRYGHRMRRLTSELCTLLPS